MNSLITEHLRQYNQEFSRISSAIRARRMQDPDADITGLQRLADIVGAKIAALHDLEDGKEVVTEVFPEEEGGEA